MPWKKRSFLNFSPSAFLPVRQTGRNARGGAKIYFILDTEVSGYNRLWDVARQAIEGGVDIIQLRDKKGLAKDILKFSEKILKFLKGRIPFIINDRVDVACALGASGVHIGQDDLPLSFARKMLGKEATIGVSCQTLLQARRAEDEGADYIGFGSVFKTKTKPWRRPMDLIRLVEVNRKIKIPVFAIGGIDLKNAGVLSQLGIRRIAVCRSICESPHIQQAVRTLKKQLRG